MKNSEYTVSLRDWPIQQTELLEYKISPISSKIIKKAGITASSLYPISLSEYAKKTHLIYKNQAQISQLYEQEKKRRKLKVKILKDLWVKYNDKLNEKKDKIRSENLKKGVRKSRKQVMTSRNSRSNYSLSLNSNNASTKVTKRKSKEKRSAYNQFYSYDQLPILKVNKKQERDKSKKQFQTIKVNISPNKEYYNFQTEPVREERNNFDSLLQKMNKTMIIWTNLDKSHYEQIKQMKNLSERERKRLLKIHKIQKQKLRQQIEQIRMKLL